MKKITFVFTLLLISVFVFSTNLFAQNNALDFDGSDDYVSCGTSLSVSGDITVSAWVKSAGVTDNDYIVTKGNDDDLVNSFGIALTAPSNTYAIMMVRTANGKYWATSPAGSIETNTWYHIAGVISSSNVYIYINGILSGDTTITGSISSSSLNLNIGKQYRTDYEYYFNGLIDEVQIWDTALSTAQIRQYMYQELNGTESNLAAYYKFNEASGTNLDDASSGNRDGTLQNMAGNEWTTSAAFFGPKNCLLFDGVDEYAEVGTHTDFESNYLTVETWVKPIATNGWQSIVTKRSDGTPIENYLQWTLQTDDGTDTYYSGINVGTTVYWADSHVPVSTDWIHLAVTYDGETLKFYANGVLKEENTAPSGAIASKSAMAIYIANRNNNEINGPYTQHFFNGYIDEIRIWNIARSASQIREFMCKPLTGTENGLVAYYNFDNTSGSTLQDFSSKDHDATLSISAYISINNSF